MPSLVDLPDTFSREEAVEMRSLIIIMVLLLTVLFAVCPIHAYVYYVEAEDFDPDTSEPNKAGCVWTVVEDKEAFNEKYVRYSGPHTGANTSLFYPIPKVTGAAGAWKIWIRCVMPDGGSDSYFFYVSNDGGDKWGPQQTAHGGGQGPDWKWENWTLITPLQKDEGNVIRIAERENAQADLICIRNDGLAPSGEEYEKWLEEFDEGKIAIESPHRATTTWGSIKKAY